MSVSVRNGLGYAGLTPFIALPWLLFQGHEQIEVYFIGYGTAIASFLTGSVWGQVIQRPLIPAAVLWVSNALCLAPWAALCVALTVSYSLGLLLMSLCFIAVYGYERLNLWSHLNVQIHHHETGYARLRKHLTLVVVLSHWGLMAAIQQGSVTVP